MSQEMEVTTTSLRRQYRRLLTAFMTSFGIWWGCLCVLDFVRPWGRWHFAGVHPTLGRWEPAVILISLASWVVWTIALVRTMIFCKALKKQPRLLASFADELRSQNVWRAQAYAFWVVVVSQFIIGFTAHRWPITGHNATDITYLIAIEAFFISFLILDRE